MADDICNALGVVSDGNTADAKTFDPGSASGSDASSRHPSQQTAGVCGASPGQMAVSTGSFEQVRPEDVCAPKDARNPRREERRGSLPAVLPCTAKDELVLKEKASHASLAALSSSNGRKPKRVVQGPSGTTYHSTSFGCLRPYHLPRRLAILLVESPPFQPFIFFMIACSCVSMAVASPLDPPGTPKAELLEHLEIVYRYIFTAEMCVRMLAMGVVGHSHAYLRDPWCRLDAIVVSVGWLPIFFPALSSNMNAIRSMRAFRPLRTLKTIPGMPVLVGSLFKAIPALGNVTVLAGMIFTVFGIVGMNLFHGVLRDRCVAPQQRVLALVGDGGYAGPPMIGVGQAGGGRHLRGGDWHLRGGGRHLRGGSSAVDSGDAQVGLSADYDTGILCHADRSTCDAYGGVCHTFDSNAEEAGYVHAHVVGGMHMQQPGGGRVCACSLARSLAWELPGSRCAHAAARARTERTRGWLFALLAGRPLTPWRARCCT